MSSGTEGNVAIVSKSMPKVKHFLAGTFAFLLGKGLFIVPFQNYLYREECLQETKGEGEKQVLDYTGFWLEQAIQWTDLLVRVPLNSLQMKYCNEVSPKLTLLGSSLVTYPLYRMRIRSLVKEYPAGFSWKEEGKALMTHVLYQSAEDDLYQAINRKIQSEDSYDVGKERLRQSVALGLTKVILSPLHRIRTLTITRTERKTIDYRYCLAFIPVSFSVIYLKYKIFKLIAGDE